MGGSDTTTAVLVFLALAVVAWCALTFRHYKMGSENEGSLLNLVSPVDLRAKDGEIAVFGRRKKEKKDKVPLWPLQQPVGDVEMITLEGKKIERKRTNAARDMQDALSIKVATELKARLQEQRAAEQQRQKSKKAKGGKKKDFVSNPMLSSDLMVAEEESEEEDIEVKSVEVAELGGSGEDGDPVPRGAKELVALDFFEAKRPLGITWGVVDGQIAAINLSGVSALAAGRSYKSSTALVLTFINDEEVKPGADMATVVQQIDSAPRPLRLQFYQEDDAVDLEAGGQKDSSEEYDMVRTFSMIKSQRGFGFRIGPQCQVEGYTVANGPAQQAGLPVGWRVVSLAWINSGATNAAAAGRTESRNVSTRDELLDLLSHCAEYGNQKRGVDFVCAPPPSNALVLSSASATPPRYLPPPTKSAPPPTSTAPEVKPDKKAAKKAKKAAKAEAAASPMRGAVDLSGGGGSGRAKNMKEAAALAKNMGSLDERDPSIAAAIAAKAEQREREEMAAEVQRHEAQRQQQQVLAEAEALAALPWEQRTIEDHCVTHGPFALTKNIYDVAKVDWDDLALSISDGGYRVAWWEDLRRYDRSNGKDELRQMLKDLASSLPDLGDGRQEASIRHEGLDHYIRFGSRSALKASQPLGPQGCPWGELETDFVDNLEKHTVSLISREDMVKEGHPLRDDADVPRVLLLYKQQTTAKQSAKLKKIAKAARAKEQKKHTAVVRQREEEAAAEEQAALNSLPADSSSKRKQAVATKALATVGTVGHAVVEGAQHTAQELRELEKQKREAQKEQRLEVQRKRAQEREEERDRKIKERDEKRAARGR